MTLEEVLANWREKADDADRLGNAEQARAIRAVVEDVARAGERVMRFLPEDRARLYCRKSVRWLRAHFHTWEAQGAARRDGRGVRCYLQIVLPVPLDLASTAADAERTAREDSAA